MEGPCFTAELHPITLQDSTKDAGPLSKLAEASPDTCNGDVNQAICSGSRSLSCRSGRMPVVCSRSRSRSHDEGVKSCEQSEGASSQDQDFQQSTVVSCAGEPAKPPGRSVPRSRSRSRSHSAVSGGSRQQSVGSSSHDLQQPPVEQRTGVHRKLPKRRVAFKCPEDDPLGVVPFQLLAPGSDHWIQCDGCGIWLECHEEVSLCYGPAQNCPFFCSCVGLPVCEGEDSDADDLEYVSNAHRGLMRKRTYRERRGI